MGDQRIGLEVLAKKYLADMNRLEEELTEAKKRYEVVSTAIELLLKDGDPGQTELFPMILSEKYKGKSMTVAIMDIIESSPNHKSSANEVFSALQKHGFQSESKNLKRDVFTRLYRLRKGGKLICRREKGIYKYYLPETKE